ncbi:MAG TPA: sigma-70 family RNA polymerase sigma factor [Vicinamibacterales bacterium]|jgi:RNA polymerase sigma factor (sigma-70 family)|nr:sigma-70 family RNA polymerase sigma factor [Vicinamibacterales bacterium]
MRQPPDHPEDGPAGGGVATTAHLLERSRLGDAEALNELFGRYLPSLRRWARGRLPLWTRDLRDTDDLVQETLVQSLKHIGEFQPRHDGALQAYLRQAIVNRIRDEVRRTNRRGVASEIDSRHPDSAASPLEEAVGSEALARYEAALQRLRAEDREAIIARVEFGMTYQQIAASQHKPSADAARMAVSRALVRLAEEMDRGV